jgi:saccharopine dehydrogenase-like NADP-dependent oxidoreductase
MEQGNNKILILGSGMMVEPLLDILLKRQTNKITIASNMQDAVKQLIEKRNNPNLKGEEVDVTSENLVKLVSKHDIVVSYVPPTFHPYVAKACLTAGRHMITCSYVSDALKKFDKEAKEKNLIFMNEIGLDPGIDHLITYKVILEAEERGDKILSYESWCGALCSPEFIDNPLLHKFSWSPKGALIALKNNAKQFINGKTVNIPNERHLTEITNKNFHPCFKFEGYFNRDSLNYKELYGFKDAHTVIRGTIRYEGFSLLFHAFKNLGFFTESKVDKETSWRAHLSKLLKDHKELLDNTTKKYSQQIKSDFFITDNSSLKETDAKFYLDMSLLAIGKCEEQYVEKKGFNEVLNKIFTALQYLDLANEKNKLKEANVFDAFATLLQEKLQMGSDERDLVFLQNEFLLKTKEGQLKKRKFDLVAFGRHNGMPYSATALLVSLPCAVTTQVKF